ncbi:MAG TPA: pectinesterase family protein [Flavobacterium sp.]
MKRKLALLILTFLLLVSYVQAQKTDVWDFGGATLDVNLYNNKLTAADINTWYTYSATIILGTESTANTLTNAAVQTLTSGVLTLKTGNSDRLYTTNTIITRYGNTLATSGDYTGRYYCNGNAAANGSTRFFTLTLNEDDEVTIITRADAVADLTIVNTTTNTQTEIIPLTTSTTIATEAKFVAKEAGNFKISSLNGKGSYYRILRKAASYAAVSGNFDVSQAAGIPSGYSVKFTNAAGKSWIALESSNTYNVNLPIGYTYEVSLLNANGYIVSSGNSLTVTGTPTNHNISILKVDLFTVTGSITGLGTDISKLSSLTYTSNPTDYKIFVPVPVIDKVNSTYTVELEANTQYTISGQGVNDYEILANSIIITGTTTENIAFSNKPIYPITITTTGLDAAQIASLTLTFTNLNESGYVYTFAPSTTINLRTGTYAITYSGLDSSVDVMILTSNLKVIDAAASKTLDFVPPADTSPLTYEPTLYVGTDKTYKTINTALADVTRMTRTATDRVTIMIDPGNYEEMIDITQPNVTFKNAAATPNINLSNKGVDIDGGAVRITSYYGLGYNYYSMKSNQKWDADVLRVNKENGYQTYANQSGTNNNSYWNATLIVSADGFEAEDIIIENSFNQYISAKEADDVLVEVPGLSKGLRPKTIGSTAVQNRSFVERAAAIAIKGSADKVILNKCRVVGRQDSFYGGVGARVVVYKGVAMGAVDYIFGGMDVVFYQTDLAMNTSDVGSDAAYITAAQQLIGRGYLMYECKVTTAIPLIETASTMRSKPGYFGRPWQANTSEVVFYNTTIETSDYTGFVGQSLIMPVGWTDSLGGQSAKMYEYGTIENSGVNNTANRVFWSTQLTEPTFPDGTPITTLAFTGGDDGWDPIPALIAEDALGTKKFQATSSVNVFANKKNVTISNVISNTKVYVYGLNGALVKTLNTDSDTNFDLKAGVWIVIVKAVDGQKTVKLMTY